LEIIVKTTTTIDLRRTVLSHGWVNLSPWNWDGEQGILSRPERLSSGQIVDIEVIQKSPKQFIVRIGQSGGISENGDVSMFVKRWLSLNWDPKPAASAAKKLSPKVARYIQTGGGRFLRGTTFYEDFVKTVCTMNASWAFTKKTVSRFVEELGDGTFPNPIQILNAGQDFLQNTIRIGYRTKVLIKATDMLLKNKLIDESGNGNEKNIRYDNLIALWGIGQYAAGHLMVLLHDYSRIPIDSEVIKYCAETLDLPENEITGFFAKWEDYSFLGYKLNRIISKTNWIG